MSVEATAERLDRLPRVVQWLIALVAAVAIVAVMLIPLEQRTQWIFAGATIAGALLVGRNKSRSATLVIAALSILMSARYMLWRTTTTLHFDSVPEFLLGSGLYLAEVYAFVILLLGFMQTSWRLNRPVVEIKGEPETWPTIDIYIPTYRPTRTPIPLVKVDDRIGSTAIPIPPEKIVAIVITHQADSPSTVTPPDADTQAIADHLIGFLKQEVAAGRMSNKLGPLQAGIGNIANAVMCGLIDSPFEDLTMYSEVLQDSTFDLIDAGKLSFASGSSITLSSRRNADVFGNLERYKDKLVLRPQEISNHPEVVRRLGIIGVNTALEFDIYGNVNSTHVCGTRMMNGIGGSGDFARNAHLSVFVTKSIAKGGAISSVVPMVSHVDHTEHDVDILVTEIGLADLRGLAPRERARVIIDNCVHPDYRQALNDYFTAACAIGGHTPHILRDALSWHINLEETGHMLKK